LLHRQLLADEVDDSLVQFTELPSTWRRPSSTSGAATYHFCRVETSARNLHQLELPAGLSMLHVGTLVMVLEPMAAALEATVNSIGDDVLVFRDPNLQTRVSADRVAYMARLERMSRRADVVKVGMDDLDFIAPDNHSIGVRRLLDGRANVMLHTDGRRIVHVHSAAGEFEVPVRRVQVADTIGAGDAFGGGFAAWWDQSGLGRHDLNDQNALRAAVAVEVAAVSCTRVGARPLQRGELSDM
jgi:fructokinase